MKKLIAWILVSFCPLQAVNVFVEGKGAYFYPTGGDFKKIYGSGGLYGGEITCQAWRELYVWVSSDCFSKNGKTCLGYRTKVYFIPIGLGLKYLKLFKMDEVRSVGLYAGAGALGTYLHTKDSSPHAQKTLRTWGAGAILKTGLLLIKDPLFFDLFTNYSFQYFHGKSSIDPLIYANDTNINGWSFGGGTGIKF